MTEAPSFMARYGARLLDNGYSIIPIMPGTKAPGRFAGGRWLGLTGWSRYCERQARAFELNIWSGWPDAGIGIACGNVVALDIDILDADWAAKVEGFARKELGDTPLVRIGQAPKGLLVFRTQVPFSPIRRHPIEILARGSQFLTLAVHPDTGRPYTWPNESPADVPLASLPVVSETQCRAFLDRAYAALPPELRKARLLEPRNAEAYFGQPGQEGTPEAVAGALEFIPNPDLGYDDWIKVGLAIKGAIGDDGRELFERWSAQSGKHNAATTAKAWRSFKPARIGAGTLYRYALEAGWVAGSDISFNPTKAAAVAAVPLGSITLAPPRPPQPGTEPAAAEPQSEPAAATAALCEAAPGVLGDMVRWMTATAVSPQPWLSLGAALCAVGTLAGHRYRLDTPDTRSNVFALALSGSGSGKDHPRRCVRRLYREAGTLAHLGGETIKSGSGLMSAVTEQPRILYQLDEFGHFVRAALDARSTSSHLREIMTNLTTLWSSATERVHGAEYADRRERPRRDIEQPCVCVYGSTVPHTFWSALEGGHIGDGSIARFLVFESPESYPDECDPAPLEDGVAPIAAILAAIASGVPQRGNLAGLTVAPHVVPLSADADALDVALRAEQLTLKRAHENTPLAAVVARMREHARRLALIAAVAANPSLPVVTAAHYRWATGVARHCVTTLLARAADSVADSPHEANLKRVLRIFINYGDWMSGHEIANRVRFLNRRDRGDIINQLIEAGDLETMPEGTETPKMGRQNVFVRAARRGT